MKKVDFKGTKGKWQMTTSALECDHNSEVATIWGDNEYGEGACLIAHIDKSPGKEKAEANARLIAAAPELLDALQKTVELMGKLDNENYSEHYLDLAMLYADNIEVITKVVENESSSTAQ